MTHDFLSYKINVTIIHEGNLGLQVALQNLEYCPVLVQSHIEIEFQNRSGNVCALDLYKRY